MCVLTTDRQCFPPDQDYCHFDFRNSDWLMCENDIISTARMFYKPKEYLINRLLEVRSRRYASAKNL